MSLFNATVADQYPVFVVQNADVLGLFGGNRPTENILALPISRRS